MKQIVIILLISFCLVAVYSAEALIPKHSGYCEPAWSPDGKKIMYYVPDPNNDNKPSVFVVELEID